MKQKVLSTKFMLKKYKPDGEIEFRPVFFNSTTKTIIRQKFGLENSFQEILYRVDNCINERSGWIVESIECQYINISTYRPLSSSYVKLGSFYVKLPVELRSPRKRLINIKNKDQKCFLWCHLSHVNPLKEHPERITKEDKKLVKDLDYDGIDFPVQENDFGKIEKKNNICINVFCYEGGSVFPKYISDQKSEKSMDLLFLTDGDKWHYVYIALCFTKQKIKTKDGFLEAVYSVLVIKMC